jgi:hypothetical protein
MADRPVNMTKQSTIQFERAGVRYMKPYQLFLFLRLEAGFFVFVVATTPAREFELSVSGAGGIEGTGGPREPWEDDATFAFDTCVACR